MGLDLIGSQLCILSNFNNICNVKQGHIFCVYLKAYILLLEFEYEGNKVNAMQSYLIVQERLINQLSSCNFSIPFLILFKDHTIQYKINIYSHQLRRRCHILETVFISYLATCFFQIPSEFKMYFPSNLTLRWRWAVISTLEKCFSCEREANFKARKKSVLETNLPHLSLQFLLSELIFVQVKLELSGTSGNPINSYIHLQV